MSPAQAQCLGLWAGFRVTCYHYRTAFDLIGIKTPHFQLTIFISVKKRTATDTNYGSELSLQLCSVSLGSAPACPGRGMLLGIGFFTHGPFCPSAAASPPQPRPGGLVGMPNLYVRLYVYRYRSCFFTHLLVLLISGGFFSVSDPAAFVKHGVRDVPAVRHRRGRRGGDPVGFGVTASPQRS